MAAYQMLTDLERGTQYEQYKPAVVSLTRGADKSDDGTKVVNELAAQQAFINKFEQVVLLFDQDEAGQKSAAAVARLWPDKVRIAKLPMKDANDMLRAGKAQEFKRAVIWNADQYKPSGIVRVADVFEKARKKAEYGLPYPWPTLTKLTYGRRRGEMIGIGAGVGCGKTTFWHQLEHQIINIDKGKVGVFMLEEPTAKTLKMIAGRFAGKNFHDPATVYAQEELDAAINRLSDHIILWDNQEDSKWESIKSAIRHMVLVEGCKDIILDPISALTFHLDSSKTNDELNKIFGEVSAMTQALGFTLYYSSHLNPPESGPPHEEGGRVKAAQFTGSRAMIKWSHYIIGLERNTQAVDEDERNTVTCRILKDREFGNTGYFPIKYNKSTGDFMEPVNYKPEGVTY
jgi:twinkle protein